MEQGVKRSAMSVIQWPRTAQQVARCYKGRYKGSASRVRVRVTAAAARIHGHVSRIPT